MNIRETVFDLVGCTFAGPVTETHSENLSVTFDGKSATIAACSKPALARGYLLLAKAWQEGKTLNITQTPHFANAGPMVDVSRGGVMKVASVKKYLDYTAALGMNIFMLYTEDTYEVEGYPLFGYQRGRYTLKELQEIDDYAYALGIEVIPCIQTLGHMEQYLRYPANEHIKDAERVLLIGEEATYDLIRACAKTLRKAFRSDRIHIGCDEAWDMGLGNYMKKHGYRDRFQLFNEHLDKVTAIVKELGYTPMMWSDLYFHLTGARGYSLEAVIPQFAIDAMPDCDMVYWDYYHTDPDFYRTNIQKHRSFNKKTVFAGGIWTWDGFAPNLRYSYETMSPALKECLRGKVTDVIATMWGDDGCETNHMLALPGLCIFSEYCWLGENCQEATIWDMSRFLTGVDKPLADAVSDFAFGYEGAYRAGKLILWTDPLVNLLIPDFDLEDVKKYLTTSLSTFDRYADHPETPYYKAVFTCCLDKCEILLNLRPRYKAGDKAWLQSFLENDLPRIICDFEALYRIHQTQWDRDYKINGFEQIMFRYAGAIERLRYTGKVLSAYLSGEKDIIEEMEAEPVHTEPAKHLYANPVMYIPTK